SAVIPGLVFVTSGPFREECAELCKLHNIDKCTYAEHWICKKARDIFDSVILECSEDAENPEKATGTSTRCCAAFYDGTSGTHPSCLALNCRSLEVVPFERELLRWTTTTAENWEGAFPQTVAFMHEELDRAALLDLPYTREELEVAICQPLSCGMEDMASKARKYFIEPTLKLGSFLLLATDPSVATDMAVALLLALKQLYPQQVLISGADIQAFLALAPVAATATALYKLDSTVYAYPGLTHKGLRDNLKARLLKNPATTRAITNSDALQHHAVVRQAIVERIVVESRSVTSVLVLPKAGGLFRSKENRVYYVRHLVDMARALDQDAPLLSAVELRGAGGKKRKFLVENVAFTRLEEAANAKQGCRRIGAAAIRSGMVAMVTAVLTGSSSLPAIDRQARTPMHARFASMMTDDEGEE
ncbi:hypothetical protein B484DRAFT_405170, partial [Ochromonadaceae sp. CCMP2298]